LFVATPWASKGKEEAADSSFLLSSSLKQKDFSHVFDTFHAESLSTPVEWMEVVRGSNETPAVSSSSSTD
jgi:hypothetical protein